MLDVLRKRIDAVDKKLIKLFEKRMDIAKKIGEYKKECGMEIFCPEREKEVLEKRAELVKNPEYKDYTKELLEKIMEFSKDLQSK